MRFTAVVAALLLTSVTLRARADVAPPPGFEESCTLEKKARAGQECHLCRAFYGNREHCSQSLAAFGFTQTCRARGASAWSEVWCRAQSATAVKVPAQVLTQLSDAQGKPGPMPSGQSSAAPSPSLSSAPAPSASATSATVSPAPAAKPAAEPVTKPITSQPKPKSRGCAVDSHDSSHASLVVAGAVLLAALRRRR